MKNFKALFALYFSLLLPCQPLYAVVVEGVTTGGGIQAVQVNASGQLLAAIGGSNNTPTCGTLKFASVQISSNVLGQSLATPSATASQTGIFNEGPLQLYISTTQAVVAAHGNPWFPIPVGAFLTLDAPASVAGPTIYGMAQGSAVSSSTWVETFTCGN